MVIGVGVDVVDLARFSRSLERTPELESRLFGAIDLDGVADGEGRVMSLAARFAAKEATLKALGGHIEGFSWHDIQVAKASNGQPVLVVTGASGTRAVHKGIVSWNVSLSHDGPVAIAFVIGQASEVR